LAEVFRLFRYTLFLIVSLLSTHSQAFGLKDCQLDATKQQASIAEHLYGGAPEDAVISPRHGFVLNYNAQLHVPHWVAWHAVAAYRDTPQRKSRWSTFRTDPEFGDVKTSDYTGWYDSAFNFARGHLVPFYISGGDRDQDGMDAEFEDSLKVEDPDDACTVYEINALSNITPQYHSRFNGEQGLWYQLETAVRELIDDGNEFYLYAGTVFIPGADIMKIGNRKEAPEQWQIGVPHGFFKVVINPQRQQAVAFLFDHSGDLADGCSLNAQLGDCIVSFEALERATGLSFFPDLSERDRQNLESQSTEAVWNSWQ
tara:strand:+ start:653 stop:1591 length:939 start_codon:yes stop_codon:yes gene_type:complete